MVRTDSSSSMGASDSVQEVASSFGQDSSSLASSRPSSFYPSPRLNTVSTSRPGSARSRSKTLFGCEEEGGNDSSSSSSLINAPTQSEPQPTSTSHHHLNLLSRAHSRRRTTSSSSKRNHARSQSSTSASTSPNSSFDSAPLGSTSTLMSNSKSWYHFSQLRHHHSHHQRQEEPESENESISSRDLMCAGAKEFDRIRIKRSSGSAMDISSSDAEKGEDEEETLDNDHSFDSFKTILSQNQQEEEADTSTADSSPNSSYLGLSQSRMEQLPLEVVFLSLCGHEEKELEALSRSGSKETEAKEVEEPNFLDFGFISSWRNCSLPTNRLQQQQNGHEQGNSSIKSSSPVSRFDSSNERTPVLSSGGLRDLSPTSFASCVTSDQDVTEGEDEEGLSQSYETARMTSAFNSFEFGDCREKPSAPASVVDDESEFGFGTSANREEEMEAQGDDDETEELLKDEEPVNDRGQERSERDLGLGLGLVFGQDEHHDGLQIVLSLASSSTNTTSNSDFEQQSGLDRHETREDFPFINIPHPDWQEDVKTPTDRRARSPIVVTPKVSDVNRFESSGHTTEAVSPFSSPSQLQSPIIYDEFLLTGSTSGPFPSITPIGSPDSKASLSPPSSFRRSFSSPISLDPLVTSFNRNSSQFARSSTSGSVITPGSLSSSSGSHFDFFGTPRSTVSFWSDSRTSLGSMSSPINQDSQLLVDLHCKKETEVPVEVDSESQAWENEASEVGKSESGKPRCKSLYIPIVCSPEIRQRSSSLSSLKPSSAVPSLNQLKSFQRDVFSFSSKGLSIIEEPSCPTISEEIRDYSALKSPSDDHGSEESTRGKETIGAHQPLLRRSLTSTSNLTTSTTDSASTSNTIRSLNFKARRRLTASSNFSSLLETSEETAVGDEGSRRLNGLRRLKSKLGLGVDFDTSDGSNLNARSNFHSSSSHRQVEEPQIGSAQENEKKTRLGRLTRIKSKLGLRHSHQNQS